jgi:hypothetical protein
MVSKLGKAALIGCVAAFAMGSAPQALAGGYYGAPYGGYYGPSYGHGNYRPYYRSDHRRGHRGNGISNGQAVLLGVGALGLGLVLSEAFDKDRPKTHSRYEYRPRAERDYPRYGDRYDVDRERRELEIERARLENERLRLENEQRRRELGDDDDNYAGLGRDSLGSKDGGGRYYDDDLDRDLAGSSGRLDYDRAFSACLTDVRRDAESRGLAVSTPTTWAEAQPLEADKVRFRADLGRGGAMVCDVSRTGVTRLDLAGI